MRLFVSFLSGIICFQLSRYFPLAVSGFLVVYVFYSIREKKLFVVFIILVSFFYASLRDGVHIEPFRCDGALAHGFMSDFPVSSDFGYASTLYVKDISECGVDVREKEVRLFSREPLGTGNEGIFSVDIKGRFRFQNPQNFRNGLAISASLKEIYSLDRRTNIITIVQNARKKLVLLFHNSFSPDVGGFLSAIVTGDRRGVDDRTRRAFASSGLAHLLAISGAHFGVFSFFIFSIFRFVLKRIPYALLNRMALYVSPSELAALLSIPFMVLYLFLSGAGIPAVRSFIMVNVFLFGLLLGRKGMWRNSISLAAFMLLLVSPDAVFDISFLLSFLAVISIGYALEWYREGDDDDILIIEDKKTVPERIQRWIAITLIVTVSAYIGTMPLVLNSFHSLSLISPVTNLIIAPLVCFVIIPVVVLCSLIYLLTGLFPLIDVLQLICHSMLALIERTGDLGFVSVTVPAFPLLLVITFYVGLLLIMFQSKKVYGAVLVPLSLVVMFGYAFLPDDTAFEATFLDVGQAESAVIRLPDKKVMVVDTGKDGKQTAAYLDYIGVDEVDALILSHAGYDHAGGIHYLTDSKKVGTVYDNGRIIYPGSLRSKIKRVIVNRGDVMRGKGYTIEILHPYDEFHTAFGSEAAAENNESLVLRITVDGKRLLFTGDIEHEAEEDMVHLGDYLKSDILKVAHHGSKTSTSDQFVSLVRPSVAVISSGMFNPYGHPHTKTLRSLGGVTTLNTAHDGAVKIRLEGPDQGKELTVTTFREYKLKPADTFADEVMNFQKLFRTW